LGIVRSESELLLEEGFSAGFALLGDSRLLVRRVVLLEGELQEVGSGVSSGLSEGLLVFVEGVNTINTVVSEDFLLFSHEVFKLVEEDEFLVSGGSGVVVFNLESSAHFDGVVKSRLVARFLGFSGGRHSLFGLNAGVKFNNVNFQ